MSGGTYHIFLNGQMPAKAVVQRNYQPGDPVIGVDGGVMHIADLNLRPTLLVGDMDSIDRDLLDQYKKAGVEVFQHPVEKDATDFELALDWVYKQTPGQVYVYAGLGGRLDHTLTNLGVASCAGFTDPPVNFMDDNAEMSFILESIRLNGSPGDLVSLIPWGGPVSGVTTENLKYPLDNETLYPDRSRGISNVMTTSTAVIHTETGRLLCIHQKS
jgi:thiamine pyrophosphokinase